MKRTYDSTLDYWSPAGRAKRWAEAQDSFKKQSLFAIGNHWGSLGGMYGPKLHLEFKSPVGDKKSWEGRSRDLGATERNFLESEDGNSVVLRYPDGTNITVPTSNIDFTHSKFIDEPIPLPASVIKAANASVVAAQYGIMGFQSYTRSKETLLDILREGEMKVMEEGNQKKIHVSGLPGVYFSPIFQNGRKLWNSWPKKSPILIFDTKILTLDRYYLNGAIVNHGALSDQSVTSATPDLIKREIYYMGRDAADRGELVFLRSVPTKNYLRAIVVPEGTKSDMLKFLRENGVPQIFQGKTLDDLIIESDASGSMPEIR